MLIASMFIDKKKNITVMLQLEKSCCKFYQDNI